MSFFLCVFTNIHAQTDAASDKTAANTAAATASASAAALPWDAPSEPTAQERSAARAAELIEERRERERKQTLGASGGSSGIFSVLRIIISLGIVALAIYGIIYFFKYGKSKTLANNPYLKLLASIPITQKTAVAVISIGNKAFLAGVSESNVSLLAEINDQELIDTMLLDYAQNSTMPAGQTFFSLIEKYLPRIARNNNAAADIANDNNINIDALRSHRERLK